MLFAITGLGVDFLLQALSPSLGWLLVARLIGGATAANFTVANAYVADITPPEERAKAMGKIGAAFGVGFIIGPVVGGLLADGDLRLPFFTAAGLVFANAIYGYLVLPESLPPDRRAPFLLAKANPFAALKRLAAVRAVGGLLWVFALVTLGQFILQTTWVLFTTFRFGWTPRDNGISLFVVGIAAATVQGVLLGKLLTRFGERRTATYGMISGATAMLLYGLATRGWMMYAIIAANALAFAVGPALQGIVSKNVDPRAQGITMGALTSLQSVLTVAAPLIGTPLLAYGSRFPSDDWRVGMPFFVAATLQAIGVAVAIRHFVRHPVDAPPPAIATATAA
jgi:DHA1 family tetracycline resistance protein-like MFS transporter